MNKHKDSKTQKWLAVVKKQLQKNTSQKILVYLKYSVSRWYLPVTLITGDVKPETLDDKTMAIELRLNYDERKI